MQPRGVEHAALGPVDLAFLDPPYGSGLAAGVLARLPLAPGGFASVETGRGESVAADGYEEEAVRTYGKARLTLLRRAPEAGAERP